MTKKQSDKRKITIMDKRSHTVDEDDAVVTGDDTAAEVEGNSDVVAAGGDQPAGNGAAEAQEVDWEEQSRLNLELAQRKQAELDNFRRRTVQEKDDIRRNAVEALLYDLFPALDGLSQAAHSFNELPAGENPLLDGVRSTIKVVDTAFQSHGIERIAETGVPFDPNQHQPLSVEDSGDVEVETVVEIYTEGYRVGDRVLKPAMVRVAKPKLTEVAEPEEV